MHSLDFYRKNLKMTVGFDILSYDTVHYNSEGISYQNKCSLSDFL